MEVDYNGIKEAILVLEEAIGRAAEKFKEIEEELENAFRENVIEYQVKYAPVLKIGDINCCKDICRKPIRKARSCC